MEAALARGRTRRGRSGLRIRFVVLYGRASPNACFARVEDTVIQFSTTHASAPVNAIWDKTACTKATHNGERYVNGRGDSPCHGWIHRGRRLATRGPPSAYFAAPLVAALNGWRRKMMSHDQVARAVPTLRAEHDLPARLPPHRRRSFFAPT